MNSPENVQSYFTPPVSVTVGASVGSTGAVAGAVGMAGSAGASVAGSVGAIVSCSIDGAGSL